MLNLNEQIQKFYDEAKEYETKAEESRQAAIRLSQLRGLLFPDEYSDDQDPDPQIHIGHPDTVPYIG